MVYGPLQRCFCSPVPFLYGDAILRSRGQIQWILRFQSLCRHGWRTKKVKSNRMFVLDAIAKHSEAPPQIIRCLIYRVKRNIFATPHFFDEIVIMYYVTIGLKEHSE